MDHWMWAFRNLWRQKKRTFLNVSTLSLGMVFLFLGLGWMGGYNRFIFKGVQDFDTGQAQLVRPDYLAEKRRLPLDHTMPEEPNILAAKQWEGVAHASGRLDFLGKISFQGKSTHLVVRALNFDDEAGVTVLNRQIKKGVYPHGPGLLVGQGLADKWKLKPGDSVYVTAFDREGAENFTTVSVSGIFSFGYSPLDDHVVYWDLSSAWSLLDLAGRVDSIVLRLKSGMNVDDWARTIHTAPTAGVELYSWRRLASETVDAVNADEGSFYFLLALVFLLATLGMLNSMSMSIHERRRELGTLRALGLRRAGVVGLVLREGVALGFVSAIVAAILATPLAIGLGSVGLDLKPYLPPDLPFPFGDRFYAVFPWQAYVLTVTAGCGASLLGSWVPALRASRAVIVRAISGRG